MNLVSSKVTVMRFIVLVLGCVSIFSQIKSSCLAKSHATEDADAVKQAKKRDADDKRLRKEQEAESERALSKQLNEAKIEFEKARTTQNSAPAEYVNALASLASAYQSSNDLPEANKCHVQALQQLESNFPESELSKVNISSLWNLLRVVPDPEYQSRFERLLAITEFKFPSQADSLVLDGVRDRQFYSHLDRDSQIADRQKLLGIAIQFRSKIYGANDYRLASFVRQYGQEFEAGGNIVEAEKQMRRAFELTKPLNDDIKASQQIELAQFYLRHEMRDKMDDSFHNAIAICNGHISMSVAQNFSFLTRAYSTSSYGGNPEKMISTLLANGSDQVVLNLDPQIDALVNSYIDSGSLSRAEKLLRQRVEATERCKSDPRANEWRLRLSDTLLALGHDAESNKLFEQVRNSVALSGGSVNQLITNREELLQRLGKKR
jgi:hypothetical protein